MIVFGKDQMVEAVAAETTCIRCQDPFDDAGGVIIPGLFGPPVTMHHECLTRSLIGGINHQKHLCSCWGGDHPADPPSLTKREAARVADMHHKLKRKKEG